MENIIKFSYNWNNKLNCDCFTTIRFSKKYVNKINQKFKVYLKDKFLFNAILLKVKPFKLRGLTDWLCFIDTGYNKETTLDIIKKMYKNIKDDDIIYILLFCRVKQ